MIKSTQRLYAQNQSHVLDTGTIFVLSAFCLSAIYGNGLIGFVALMALTFLGILVVLVANYSN